MIVLISKALGFQKVHEIDVWCFDIFQVIHFETICYDINVNLSEFENCTSRINVY